MSGKILYLFCGSVVGVAVGFLCGKSFHSGGSGGEQSSQILNGSFGVGVVDGREGGSIGGGFDDRKGGDDRKDSELPSNITDLSQLFELARTHPAQASRNLDSALQSMTVEQLRGFSDELEKSRNRNRYTVTSAVIQRWAELDADSLFAHADTVGRGLKRQFYANAFQYLSYADPERALRQYRNLSDRRIRSNALYYLVSGLGDEMPEIALELLEDVPDNWGGNHSDFFQRIAEDDPQQAFKYLEEINRSGKRSESIRGIMEAWDTGDSAGAVAWIEKLSSASEKKSAMRAYLGKLAAEDPERALKIAESKTSVGNRGEALQSVVNSWFEADADGAIDYIKTLSPAMQERVGGDIASNLSEMPEKAMALVKELPKGSFRTQVLRSSMAELARSSPDEAVAFVSSLDDELEQRSANQQIADSWAEHDPVGAAAYLATLDADSEPKEYAYREVAASFAKRDPFEALKWANELESSEKKNSALRSIVGPLIEKDTAAFVELVASEQNEEQRKSLISTAFSHLADVDIDVAAAVAEELPAKQRLMAMSQVLGRVGQEDPIGAAKQLDKLAVGLDGNLHENGLSNSASWIASSWSQVEPEKATDWAFSLPDDEAQKIAVGSAVGNWLERDSYAASQWVGRLPEGDTRDAAVTRVIANVRGEDPEAGFAWANSLSDETLRSDNLRYAVQSWKRKDKSAASQAVIEGNFSDQLTKKLLEILE